MANFNGVNNNMSVTTGYVCMDNSVSGHPQSIQTNNKLANNSVAQFVEPQNNSTIKIAYINFPRVHQAFDRPRDNLDSNYFPPNFAVIPPTHIGIGQQFLGEQFGLCFRLR